MLTWCTILFLLGVTAFLDSIFNYGQIFQATNAILFMLVSLGILIRVLFKMKSRNKEKVLEENVQLKRRIEELTRQKSPDSVSNTA
jgi:hypothetical protein